MPTKEKCIEELLKELNQLQSDYTDLINAANSLPTAATLRLLKKIAHAVSVLSNVPASVWKALWHFLRCDYKALGDLAVNEVKQMLEVLKTLAELELEGLAADNPAVAGQREALQRWLSELCEKLDSWDATMVQDAAVAIATALKDFLKAHHPKILAALVTLFGDDILDGIKSIATGPGAKKALIKLLLKKLLQRIGTDIAKALIPGIGAFLALVELTILLSILDSLDTLKEMIDLALAQLILKLIEKGFGWKADNFAFFIGDKYCEAKVTKKARLKCGKKIDGRWVFGDPCPLPFSDGKTSITVTLEKKKPMYDPDKKKWVCPYKINNSDVTASPCFAGAKLCMYYIDLIVTTSDGKTTTTTLIGGATKM